MMVGLSNTSTAWVTAHAVAPIIAAFTQIGGSPKLSVSCSTLIRPARNTIHSMGAACSAGAAAISVAVRAEGSLRPACSSTFLLIARRVRSPMAMQVRTMTHQTVVDTSLKCWFSLGRAARAPGAARVLGFTSRNPRLVSTDPSTKSPHVWGTWYPVPRTTPSASCHPRMANAPSCFPTQILGRAPRSIGPTTPLGLGFAKFPAGKPA
mmetsp:Transcript_112468/g.257560  ORF Transcript_112468/g.257560 Transcript_112468/m.257560 type:complete len:208 (+) Transcript_112468:2530-3153(+)